MDASKLSQMISVLTKDNEKLEESLAEYLDAFSQLTQPANTAAQRANTIQSIPDIRADLKALCQESPVNDFSPSDFKMLTEIGGENNFGLKLFDEIDKILAESSYNTDFQKNNLEEFIATRNKFIKSLSKIKSGFEDFNIQPHYTTDIFEIGILFSKEDTAEIPTLNKNLKEWGQLLKALGEIYNADSSEIRISYLNNGSLQFFVEKTYEVALAVLFIKKCLVIAFEKMHKIQEALKVLEQNNIPQSNGSSKEEIQKKLLDEATEEVNTFVLRSFTNDGRKHELKTQLGLGVKFVARALDTGIEIEVIPPVLTKPTEPDGEEFESQQGYQEKLGAFEKLEKGISETRKLVKEIKEIGHDGKEIVGLLVDNLFEGTESPLP